MDLAHTTTTLVDAAATGGAPTRLDIVTLILAIVGVVTGIIALVWQAVEFRLSGPRVVLEVTEALVLPNGAVFGPGVWTATSTGSDGAPDIAVTATNKGRAPVTVQGVRLDLPAGNFLITGSRHSSPSLPHRLEASESATWFADLRVVAAVATTAVSLGATNTPVKASAELGDGRRVTSKKSLMLPP